MEHRPKRRCSNNMMLVNVWVCLIILVSVLLLRIEKEIQLWQKIDHTGVVSMKNRILAPGKNFKLRYPKEGIRCG